MLEEEGGLLLFDRQVRKGISNIKCLLNKDLKEVKKGAMRMGEEFQVEGKGTTEIKVRMCLACPRTSRGHGSES